MNLPFYELDMVDGTVCDLVSDLLKRAWWSKRKSAWFRLFLLTQNDLAQQAESVILRLISLNVSEVNKEKVVGHCWQLIFDVKGWESRLENG